MVLGVVFPCWCEKIIIFSDSLEGIVVFSPAIDQLIEAFQCLPGVGRKSAQRMALHLLERQPDAGMVMAESLRHALSCVEHCSRCRNLTEEPVCAVCRDDRRDDSLLCIVETPSDVFAMEQTGVYRGYYFVLLGRLSPMDGIGPKELGLDVLRARVHGSSLKEIIIATNPTLEGEATASLLMDQFVGFSGVISRLSHGVPIGTELEFVGGSTLMHALNSRQAVAHE